MSIPKLKIYLPHKDKLQIYKSTDANVHRKFLAQKHLTVILRSSTILLTNVKILTCPKPNLYELTISESVYVSLGEDRKTCFASVPGFSLDIAIHSETCIHTLPNGNSEVIGSAHQKNPMASIETFGYNHCQHYLVFPSLLNKLMYVNWIRPLTHLKSK